MAGETTTCPWCAEEILAAARKCKHCGEFLGPPVDAPNFDVTHPGVPGRVLLSFESGTTGCSACGVDFGDERAAEAHWRMSHEAASAEAASCAVGPCDSPRVSGSSYCEKHGPRKKSGHSGAVGSREKLSKAGKRTDAGLACPKCSGTQFTAKRSNKGKLMMGVLAPKTQVKCVTCGTMYKRG